MNLHSGLPYWLVKSGLPYTYYPLAKPAKADVVIMGGGISGALAAYYLIEAGVDCIVADARTIGLGSTCVSTSLLQYEIDVPLSKLKNMRGLYDAARAYSLCKRAIEELATIAKKIKYADYELKNSLYYAAYKKDAALIKEEYALRKAQGFLVDYLSEEDIYKQFLLHAPCAILSHHGAQMNAYLYTHHLLQYGIQKGLRVYDRTCISNIQHGRKKVQLQTAEGLKIVAKKLIFATGYEVVKYIDKKIVDLQSTYAVISENMQPGNDFFKYYTLIWNTADPYLYMRSTPDNRIICGGRDEEFSSPVKRDRLLKHKAKLLGADFKKLLPHIPFKMEFSWTGTFGSTKDGLPFIGEYKKLPNSYFALGFGGNGITFSQVAAEIIRDLMTGKKKDDAKIFAFERR